MTKKDKKTSIANSAQPSQELNLGSNVAIDDYGYSIDNGDDDGYDYKVDENSEESDDIDARPVEHNEEELGYSTSSSTPKVTDKSDKEERKEKRKAELNRIGNNLAAWWNAFNNYEETKPATTSGGTTANSGTTTGASATTPQGASTTGVTTTTGAPTTTPQGTPTNVEVANQVDGASTTTATTTNGGASTTTDDSNLTALQKAEKNYREAGEALKQGINKSHEALINELKGSQSVYQKMVEKALENKSNLAERKERNARSRALTNALGTLIGTFTAHGMAKKGGYAPIVNAHDSSVDSDYRKSLEQRYALENEKENLLMQLEQDRRKHEADIAGKLYDKDVKNLEIDYKNAADIYKTAIQRENKLEQWDHDIEVAKIRSGQKSTAEKSKEQKEAAEKEAKQQATNFMKGVYGGVKTETTNNVGGIETSGSEKDYTVSSTDVDAGLTIIKKANKANADLEKVQNALNYVARYYRDSLFSSDVQDAIIKMVANGNSQAEIEEVLREKLTTK